jgi:glycosidase
MRPPPSPVRLARRLILLAALFGAATASAAAGGQKLHVPSPDWRDQVIYFAVTDRFDDGDRSNDDQHAGEYDPGREDRHQGGDLRGLGRRLDYIRGLGATALWITPPVANQWMDPSGQHSGYHGYWAEHFMKVDRHLGSLADYRLLSDGLHRRGMYLVQDIVLNHTGNYFGYRGGWRADEPAAFFERYADTPPVAAPSQFPFNLNDARDPAQRRAAIYHWTPDIADYTDPNQEANFQMAGLDDLNTESPVVRRALRRSYGHWIRTVGVDAFRVDTAFYVPPDTFVDFLRARDPKAPGIATVARQTGRRDFLVFGEGFGIDRPLSDEQSRKIERYMTGPDGRPVMPGMLNFPLYGAFNDVFARGRPTMELGHRIASLARLHARPHLMPTFVDNHDVDRFLAGGSVPGLKQALLAMLTLPGIPTLYYGTEQGLTRPRAAMFAAGWGSDGRDHFDTDAPLYRAIAEMTALRRAHKLFSRGWPDVLRTDGDGPGVLAYRMRHEGRQALVVFNTDEQPLPLEALDLSVPAGTVLKGLYGLQGRPADVAVGQDGKLNLALPPRSGQVWLIGARAPAAMPVTLPEAVSPRPRHWIPLADVADPADDDRGPSGRYLYPTDASYGDRHTMDLRRIEVAGADGALRIDLTMADISTTWNPPNGFDHVAFTIFIELPGREGGATVMPLQNGQLPAGMRWHYRLRVNGWSNALFSAEGASDSSEGRPVTPAAGFEVDRAQRRIRITLPAASLGRLPSLSGLRLYVNTWDYDGGYRALAPGAQSWGIGGGDPATDARVMDDSVVITLP